jgi:hypothetical protein
MHQSAVSRRLVAATRTQLTAQLKRRLDELALVALFLDGVHVAGQTLIVALGSWLETNSHPDAVANLREGWRTSSRSSSFG